MAGLRFLGGGVIQFTDNSGNPLAAGTINTYITGTTTDKTTYSDSARTTPNANPITLDSNGKAVIYLMNNGEYRFLLKTSAGATVDTIDNVAGQVRTHQGCLVLRSSAQLIPNNVGTMITLDGTERYDTQAFHDPATNPSRMTVPTGSSITKIRVGANMAFATNATGERRVAVTKNGTQVYLDNRMAVTTAGSTTYGNIQTPPIVVAEGDYFEISVYQNSGGDLNVTGEAWLEVIE